MEEERYQKELFPYEPPKRRFSALFGIFKKTGLNGPAFAVTLKMDKVVFLSIAVIMLMVIVYALGVERGRTLTAEHAQPPARTQPQQAAAPVKARADVRPAAQLQPQAAPAAAGNSAKPYTIALAALSKKESAIAEAARARNNGFDSFVMYSEPFYVVCVGAFADKTSAASQRELLKLRRFYKDAYFKQR